MPHILLPDSLRKALAVLRRVNINTSDQDHIDVETYCNGREQGFCIGVRPKHIIGVPARHIVFAESRGSDDMVIAWSEPTHRMAPGNLMDEESWNARRVHVADLELTAETVGYIIRRMLKDVTPEREQVEAFMNRTYVRR